MKSLVTLCFLVPLFATHACCVVAAEADAAARPNIMVFLVDDMGMMDTSVPFLQDENGQPKRYPLNDYYRTPGMERLASQGIRFNQFYAMSVCSPTRISIMTGQNAARHRTTNWINPRTDNAGKNGAHDWNWAGLTEGDVTLPGILSQNGYRTIHVGKGHFGPEEHSGAEPLNLGFDVNVAGAAFGAPGSYYGKMNFGHGTKRSHHAVPHLDAYHGTETFLTEALTIEAKKRVTETVGKGQPFYLYFAHYAVHAPFESDPRFADHYADSGKPKNAQAFATLIEGMDKSLGDMLDHLNELGVAENTLVLFLGDNGSDAPLGHQHEVACAEPLRGKKGAHYEGGMRVPFIAAWAKPNSESPLQKSLAIPAGQIQNQVASVSDLFPTVLSLVGAEAPASHVQDGAPLQTLLTGASQPDRSQQFLMHYPHAPHRSNYFTVYRDGAWKVVYHYLPEKGNKDDHIDLFQGHYQLFNLDQDPFESANVAADHPDELNRMMESLIESLKSHQAVYPIDDSGKAVLPQLPG
ncbi:sulfatase-like hydrolase/transferase [Stieleria varia]|uniref:Arylsulfatase n=1 Tax=Stieleria varia TaxID=2528005 RepID=A0A5C6AFV1_9BACT|nr:sulfatase-like hydrolase/transferase [Stieleria varia]TWT98320.1 Arylsulfatase precursor [Stieleria varia]